MITELRLMTGSMEISHAFWAAIYPDAAVEHGVDRWGDPWTRFTPTQGTAIILKPALSWQFITTLVMRVRTDAGAADRLLAAGRFEVATDCSNAIDNNGTDSTVWFEVP